MKKYFTGGVCFLALAAISAGLAFSTIMLVKEKEFNPDIFLGLLVFGIMACIISVLYFRAGFKKAMIESGREKKNYRLAVAGVIVLETALIAVVVGLFNLLILNNPTNFFLSLLVALVLSAISIVLFIWGKKNT